MTRVPDRATLAYWPAITAFLLFGAVRVAAPASVLGLVFDHPITFAAFGAASVLLAVALMSVPRVELWIGRLIAGPSRPPTPQEMVRLGPMLARLKARSGIDTDRLIVRVQDDPRVNAAAGASRLLFVTLGALSLPDRALEAALAHELGHHRGLHPLLAASVWWLSLPGMALAAVVGLLKRSVTVLGSRAGVIGDGLAALVRLALLAWQVLAMWLFYVAEMLASFASRMAEYRADAAAAQWGYGDTLSELYTAIAAAGGPQSRGRTRELVSQLMADHPPLERRIAALERGAA